MGSIEKISKRDGDLTALINECDERGEGVECGDTDEFLGDFIYDWEGRVESALREFVGDNGELRGR